MSGDQGRRDPGGRYRAYARVEDRIRTGTDTGLDHFPSRVFAINSAWSAVVMLAVDLLAWTQRLLLEGDLAKAEPKTLRYRLLHVAARITRGQRRTWVRMQQSWPWAHDLAAGHPTENSQLTRCSGWVRKWASNALVQPAVSARTRMSVPVAVRVRDLRERGVEHSDVVGGGVRAGVATAQQPGEGLGGVIAEGGSGWYSKVPLNVVAACSFSEWQTTIEASMSMTSTSRSQPATPAGGNARPWLLACWVYTTSRALARAAATEARPASSSRPSNRQQVESDATGPNNAA